MYAYSMYTIRCRQGGKWLSAIVGFFWGHSWLSFCGADLDRGKSFALWRHHLHHQSLPSATPTASGVMISILLPLTTLFCLIFCWFNGSFETNWSQTALRNLSAASELHDTMAKIMLEGPPSQQLGSLAFVQETVLMTSDIDVIMPCWNSIMIRRLDK